jgi:hypothetical protein
VVYFRSGAGEKTLTEVFVEIPYATLTFVRTGKGYEAGVEVGVVFEDDSGFQTDGDAIADVIRVDNLEATQSRNQARLFYLPFRVEPGSYTLRLIVEDGNTGNRFVNAVKINVPSFRSSQLQISSLQLARNIKFSEIETPLRKNGRLVIPNVPHIIPFEKPVGFLYFEAYNLNPDASSAGSLQVNCHISRLGKEMRAKSWTISNSETQVAISVPLDLEELEPGEYLLTMSVVEPAGKRQASAVAVFYITRAMAWANFF